MKRTLVIAVAVVALVFGLVAYAGAADDPLDNTGTTTVSAKVNPKMEITVPPTTVLTDVDPDTPGTGTCTVTGKSNKASTLTATINKGTFTSLASAVAAAPVSWGKGGNLSHTDTVTGTVDWNVDPSVTATATGSITYTITQP